VPITPTYPGVYIEEVSSGVHPITGVATSITAFVGFAPRGPVNTPIQVQSFTEYTSVFGGLAADSTMGYAVMQYFQNGGQQALIVRAVQLTGGGAAKTGKLNIGSGAGQLKLEAADPGIWSQNLLVRIDHDGSPGTFNMSIKDTGTGTVEVLRNLVPDPNLQLVVASQSRLVVVDLSLPTALPPAHAVVSPGVDPFDTGHPTQFSPFPNSGANAGVDGGHNETFLVPVPPDGTGVYALARADLFNLLVIPPNLPASNSGGQRVLRKDLKGLAADFCAAHRAFFLVDPYPDWEVPGDLFPPAPVAEQLSDYATNPIGSDSKPYAALYMPYLMMTDPLTGAPAAFPPSASIAGVMARTDASRGVWKAPAGLEAGLNGVLQLTSKLTDGENGIINPIAVNALRTFPAAGIVVWGARTLAGADTLASEWKYVPVRRLANYLEESLFRGTQWVVFEPNDEPLWAQIRLNVGAFMHNLFRQGAFQGTTPRDAYLVKCDKETTTQTDINNGVVNILVAFAPLKPAEFVVIRIQQLAGQIET
jgi:phage tail sheath protein FI